MNEDTVKNSRKHITILSSGGGELANQLWNYISVYAYCLAHGHTLSNPAFFEYAHFFSHERHGRNDFLVTLLSLLARGGKRKWSLNRRIARKLYGCYVAAVKMRHRDAMVEVQDESAAPLYLPTLETAAGSGRKVAGSVYLSGWLFRDPAGIEKYRAEIVRYFAPNEQIEASAQAFIAPLKEKYPHMVGVHVRQGDYRTWRNGVYFIEQERMAEVMQEYLEKNALDTTETCFAIASDGPIELAKFPGLNAVVTGKNMVEDLFILSHTSAVIGSNSTFGDFAAYYGNIPHIIATKKPIDWTYYADKNTFFPNKYCTWVHY